ncbi:hypothetical protein GCM10023115_33220 [Pontixanthobacter gangjinensis]|uniref:Uncharacterized protein n=1 Tax=Christiangramia aestuarii TaxID=1028746 RepID=A0A7K1LSI7_9FLAO|nr:hypothetical protein [Christiangramia aestuarii]MUP43738.1 hypothetical protein [Christiangramia aestuarii]
MKLRNYLNYMAVATVALGLFSCEKDEAYLENSNVENSKIGTNINQFENFNKQSLDLKVDTDYIKDFGLKIPELDAVEPSACSTTAFNTVTSNAYGELVTSIVKIWDRKSYTPIDLVYGDYFTINNYAAQLGINAGYFGKDGEYTNYVNNQKRGLEQFWNMPDMIRVHGQHTKTLADLEVIEFMYTYYSDFGLVADDPTLDENDEIVQEGATIKELLSIAEKFNTNSDQIPENVVYASDAFATSNGTIVLGDGIIELLTRTGLEDKIVISSILSHEWAHQIQFANFTDWSYPVDAFARTPESTRMTELEADFLTGFYLTHKRGGTYNWKRVEEVLTNFYFIGDCGFENKGHHGTPIQRLKSAKAGYDFAQAIQEKGFLPTATEVHSEFLNNFDDIL